MAESSSLNDLKQMLADELAKEQLPPSPSLDAPPASAQKTIEVEGPTLFQDSVLWQWQREFFAQAGPEAWRGGIVPHYITSSSYLAYSYAQVVLAYQQDRALAGETAPLTVMELGGGSGQFTFLFLKHYWESAAPYLPPLEYVFTDVVQANLDFVAQHPLLARPQEHGLLDVALFDISHPQPLTLQGSDTPWLTEPTDGPLLVIANYLWDTVPMELWRFQEGQAYPLQVALSLPASPGQPVDYTRLPDLVLSYTEGKPEAPLHPMLTQLLAADFEGDVLFPKIGLDCLDWLNQQVQGQLLLLSGDKPQTEGAAPHQPLQPVHHGSFSLPVNFEAFRWWAQQQGGFAFTPLRWHRSLHVGWYAASHEPDHHLQRAIHQYLEDFHPGDQFVLKRAVEEQYSELTPEEVLAYVRFSRYDSKALRRGLATLMGYVNGYTEAMRQEILEVIRRAWDNYYPLGENPDLPFLIGSLLYEMDFYAEAKQFFEFSAQLYGPDEGTLANIKSCQEMMD